MTRMIGSYLTLNPISSLPILTRVAACAITSYGTSDAQEGKKQKTKDPLPR